MRIGDINRNNYAEYVKLWSNLLNHNSRKAKQSITTLSGGGDLLTLSSKCDTFTYTSKTDELIAQVNQRIQAQAAALSPKSQPYNSGLSQSMLDYNRAKENWVSNVSNEIGRVLRENGITISDNENYVFKIGSDARVRVEGSDDAKAAKIADAINNAKVQGAELERMSEAISGKSSLSEHMLWSKLVTESNKVQTISGYRSDLTWTSVEKNKFFAGDNLYRWTGLNLNDVDFTDKGVFTKDGEDVYRLIRDNVNKHADSAFIGLGDNIPDDIAKEVAMRRYEYSSYASYAIKLLEAVRVAGPDNIKDYDIVLNYGKNGLF